MKEAKALMALSNVKILPIDNLDEAASMVSLVDCTVGCHNYWRGAIFARKLGLLRHLRAAVTSLLVEQNE